MGGPFSEQSGAIHRFVAKLPIQNLFACELASRTISLLKNCMRRSFVAPTFIFGPPSSTKTKTGARCAANSSMGTIPSHPTCGRPGSPPAGAPPQRRLESHPIASRRVASHCRSSSSSEMPGRRFVVGVGLPCRAVP